MLLLQAERRPAINPSLKLKIKNFYSLAHKTSQLKILCFQKAKLAS